MNLFIFDKNLKKSAQQHCNSHVVKMQVEAAQIISTTLVSKGFSEDFLMKPTHAHHPIVIWSQKSSANLRYVADYGEALYEEYMFRFKKPNKFIRPRQIFQFVKENFAAGPTTPFALAMPQVYQTSDPYESYRNYFRFEKTHLFNWGIRGAPDWISQ